MKILITGIAGFIGYHLASVLSERGDEITGLDNINDYYDVSIKFGRLNNLGFTESDLAYNCIIRSHKYSNLSFIKLNLEDKKNLDQLFSKESFDKVINLAAQAGVRYSLENPQAYIDSNIIGFTNILECCRNYSIKHLTYASSSSVYGLNEKQPFSTKDNVDHPLSLYAASKKSNELMAHTYSHLFNIPTTGLRFFTVYGPWGRPDMALFLFTKAILNNEPISVYNFGKMQRDFTYISDIIEGIVQVNDHPPSGNKNWDPQNPDPSNSIAPYKLYNIGNSKPVELSYFIETIEKELGKRAIKNLLPLQAGDVPSTFADVSDLMADFNFKPETSVETGIKHFIDWYKSFYQIT
ncbi:NAD-dependent epimerase [Apibacter sp. HY039]|uniref:NAD-dependent epimerase n=1 Tax=Apibacter sp. HY039 TaxID=2501476 RepID=UPI000FEC031B|nr:NAD-dependent epimerase [Apibacter sp. HY039]